MREEKDYSNERIKQALLQFSLLVLQRERTGPGSGRICLAQNLVYGPLYPRA
jgi:hypothetical protein